MLQIPTPRSLGASLAPLLLVLAAGVASAAEFPLTVELRRGAEAAYGAVWVEEDDSGGLYFEVEIDPEVLGDRSRMKRLFFNLDGEFTGLRVRTDDPVRRPYRVKQRRNGRPYRVLGARFDAQVNFRSSSSRRRNGMVQTASFTLSADQPLSVEDLFPLSATRRGEVAQMALRVRNTIQRRSLLLGGVYDPASEPEPGPDLEPTPGETEPGPGSGPPLDPRCEEVWDLVTGEVTYFCP